MSEENNEKKTNILFIRHGKTSSNLEKRYCGARTDEDLCDEGIRELKKKKEEGMYPSIDMLYCGKKKRCISTAEILYPEMEKIIIDEFDEIDFGDFEGKNYEELKENPEYINWLESGGKLPFPNGESREEYCEREWEGFEKILDDIKPVHIGVIAHGGTIMAVLSHLTKDAYFDFQTECGDGYLCTLSGEDGSYHIELTKLTEATD